MKYTEHDELHVFCVCLKLIWKKSSILFVFMGRGLTIAINTWQWVWFLDISICILFISICTMIKHWFCLHYHHRPYKCRAYSNIFGSTVVPCTWCTLLLQVNEANLYTATSKNVWIHRRLAHSISLNILYIVNFICK